MGVPSNDSLADGYPEGLCQLRLVQHVSELLGRCVCSRIIAVQVIRRAAGGTLRNRAHAKACACVRA